MKSWRISVVGIAGVVLAAGFIVGPAVLRYLLFWLCFFALPGPLALRFLNVHNGWAYLAAGAASAALGLAGADYPMPPVLNEILGAAFIGAVFGFGWKFLLDLRAYPIRC